MKCIIQGVKCIIQGVNVIKTCCFPFFCVFARARRLMAGAPVKQVGLPVFCVLFVDFFGPKRLNRADKNLEMGQEKPGAPQKPAARFELATFALQVRCSTTKLYWPQEQGGGVTTAASVRGVLDWVMSARWRGHRGI